MRISIAKIPAGVWWLLAVLLLGGTAAGTYRLWLPPLQAQWVKWQRPAEAAPAQANHEPEHGDEEHGHEEHGHEHGEQAANRLHLSPQALKNIGYVPLKLQPAVYQQTLDLPATVVERPGRSQFQVAAPLSGIVTHVHPIEGGAIEPGSRLFEIRLSHEELATAQRDFLKMAVNLDVVQADIQRLKELGEGVVAGRRVIELEYEQRKLQASLQVEAQGLVLHGLSKEQVANILKGRQVLEALTVFAPSHLHEEGRCQEEHLFHVQQLQVKVGQQVEAGQTLCTIADHCELFVEGKAFEDDAPRLRQALEQGLAVTATLAGSSESAESTAAHEVSGLKLLFLADHIDLDSRSFAFYLALPNEIALDQTSDGGHRFIHWKYRPGQRLELHVPVRQWANRFVVPIEAIVDEGAEVYAFKQNGDDFEPRPVHVEFRDQRFAVLANDGSVFSGDVIAAKGAYQMHLALQNQAGGGVDPHAGHSH